VKIARSYLHPKSAAPRASSTPYGLFAIALLAALAASGGFAAGSAGDAGPPLLRVLILPSLMTELADQVLPIRLQTSADITAVTNQALALTELLYCGADERGNGVMIGVVEEGLGQPRARSLAKSDCQRPLADIASRELRLPDAPEWVEAAHIYTSWKPWQLTLAVADTASAARMGFAAPKPAAGELSRSFATNNLQPLTGPGRDLAYDLALRFMRDGVVIEAYPTGGAANPNANSPGINALAAQLRAAPPDTNVIAEAPYPFINQMLSIYSPTFNIPVSIQGLSAMLLARNLSLSGGENQLTLTGQVINQSGGQSLAYDARVDCAGDDLAVREVSMSAAGANCSQPDVMTWLECQSARGLSAALTAYYQNQPLHVSTRSHPLDFRFGGNDYEAFFTALKTTSNAGAVSEDGQAVVQRAGINAMSGGNMGGLSGGR
jgi:hypothetical protein